MTDRLASDARPLRHVGRWLPRALLALLVVLVTVVAAIVLAVERSRATEEGTLRAAGLRAPVEIRFDALGRPYASARTLEDALYAQGMLHARERLWQMELLRRAGHGRLAEIFGASLLDTDRSLWRAGVPQLAARLADAPSADAAQRVAAYVAGVNAGIASLPVRPPEFLLLQITPQPWTAADVYAVGAMIAWDSSNNLANELVRLDLRGVLDETRFAAFVGDGGGLARYPYVIAPGKLASERLAALDPVTTVGLPNPALGSNGWAVAGGRTHSGHPLLAFDSHDALSMPTLFYEVHLFFGQGRQLRGWSLPGLPGVINGYNEYIAWGVTNIGDTQDLFVLPPEAIVRRRDIVTIPVRGVDVPTRLEIEQTDFGPVFSDSPRLALSWTGQSIGRAGLDAILALNLATSPSALATALDRFEIPVANVTWASRDGHIGFRTVGRLPIRAAGEGLVPLLAAPGMAWRGLVAVENMPRRNDPADGFVAAANARVNAPGDGPLVSADNAAPYRIRRIRSWLAGRSDHDVASMQALQRDWWNSQAEELLPAMLPSLAGVSDVRTRDVSRVLESWQRHPVNEPQLAAPLIFERWYLALAARLFADAVGPALWPRLLQRNYLLNGALDRLILQDQDSPWWRGDRDGMLLRSLTDAIRDLDSNAGPDPADWQWGDHHRVVIEHELGRAVPLLGHWLDRGPYPWGGGAATVGRANYRYDHPERANHAATVRMVADMAPTGLVVSAVIAGGQSGHPLSPHYADQIPAWLAGRQYPIARSPAEVAGSTLRLQPVP